jgi:hypothetical protein
MLPGGNETAAVRAIVGAKLKRRVAEGPDLTAESMTHLANFVDTAHFVK